MKNLVDELELLIQKYVFVTDTKEKANIIKTREDAKAKLREIRDIIATERASLDD
jgi:hypothetical protein